MSNQDIEISELRSRLAVSEASLARLVEGIRGIERWALNLADGVLEREPGGCWVDADDLAAILPAKVDKPVVPTRAGITIDHKTFHDMMENYRAAVSEGTARHTYRVTVEFVDLYAAQQREAGYHAGFMDASKPQPDNGG